MGLAASFAFGIAGCSGSSDPVPLPPLTSAPLTTEATIQLVHAMGDEKDTSPSDVMGLQTLLSGGWGDTQAGAGEGVAPHTLDGSAPPSPSASPKLLARFVHLADTQLSDDESPSRTVEFDTMGSTYAAYRPQEAWICKMLNAAVRTIEKVHETLPFEFVLLGGDNADNAQTNEEDWFLGILGGAPRVECDSGNDDDPTPGPNNDPKDPFIPTGLTTPWKWVTGNHDVLNQGNFRPFDKLDDYLGNASSLGTRDWAQVGAPMTTGSVIPDARRQPLDRTALMLKIAGDGDGHGITAEAKAAGKAYYHFDVAGGAVRIVVLDTAAETGGADGVLHRADMMSFVKPALDEAETLGKYVILVSHHSAPTLTTGGGLGIPQADAVLQDEWETF